MMLTPPFSRLLLACLLTALAACGGEAFSTGGGFPDASPEATPETTPEAGASLPDAQSTPPDAQSTEAGDRDSGTASSDGATGSDGTTSSDSATSNDGGSVNDTSPTDSNSGDAGPQPCATDAGTGATGTPGCSCPTAGGLACKGNAQKQSLLCSGGVWVPNGTCGSGLLCDTASGSNHGTCQPIDPLCANAAPGQDVCSNATTAIQCGADLLSDSPVATCTNQTCVSGACAGVCAPGATQCASATAAQTCGPTGQWVTASCPFVCIGQSCGGICKPGATQQCSECANQGTETCNASGQWGVCSVSC